MDGVQRGSENTDPLIDGGEAEGTVRFGLDGTEYEIDLSVKNADALRMRWRGTFRLLVEHPALPDGQAEADVGRVAAASIPPMFATGPKLRASRSRIAVESRLSSSPRSGQRQARGQDGPRQKRG
jgi:hypothetical protein